MLSSGFSAHSHHRSKASPGVLKICAGLLDGRRRAVLVLARVGAGIEAASPAPWIFVEGNAGTDLDRAGVDIATINVPAFLRRIGTTAAGEGGHAALKRSQRAAANRPTDWCEAG
jgi:hypothetical protein